MNKFEFYLVQSFAKDFLFPYKSRSLMLLPTYLDTHWIYQERLSLLSSFFAIIDFSFHYTVYEDIIMSYWVPSKFPISCSRGIKLYLFLFYSLEHFCITFPINPFNTKWPFPCLHFHWLEFPFILVPQRQRFTALNQNTSHEYWQSFFLDL